MACAALSSVSRSEAKRPLYKVESSGKEQGLSSAALGPHSSALQPVLHAPCSSVEFLLRPLRHLGLLRHLCMLTCMLEWQREPYFPVEALAMGMGTEIWCLWGSGKGPQKIMEGGVCYLSTRHWPS